MSISKKLGKATGSIKRAARFGDVNPFGSGMFPGYNQQFMPSMMPPGMGGMGGPQQPSGGGMGAEAPETPASRAGDRGTGQNALWGGLSLMGAASPWMIPANAAFEGAGYAMKGEMPAYSDVEAFRQNYAIDPNKDSFLGAGKKLVGGVGGFLSNPISAFRMIGNDADKAWSDDKTYQGAKGVAQQAASAVGTGYQSAKNMAGQAYDRVANQPINGAPKPAPAPRPMAKPIAKPPTPSALGGQTATMGNPAANKPQI